jgi:hypothetical protein
MTETIQLNLPDGQKELVLRTGQAAKVFDPVVHNIIGGAGTIKQFIEKRRTVTGSWQQVDKHRDFIVVSPDELKAVLYINPETAFSWTVTSMLTSNQFLDNFGINAGLKFSRKEMIKLIKFNSHLFADHTEVNSLLSSLQSLKVDANISNFQEGDNRGNATKNLHKSVVVDVLKTFILQAPLYQYADDRRFVVELCFETTDTDILFWMESSELAMLEVDEVAGIFRKEFESFEDFLIIYS